MAVKEPDSPVDWLENELRETKARLHKVEGELEQALKQVWSMETDVKRLTEAFTSVLVLQCAERRQVDLNREITNYGGEVPDDRATVRQVLSHTSAPPGNYKYEPGRYAQLTGVVEYCSRQSFRKAVALDLLDRLAMARSVPGRDFATAGAVPADLLDKAYFDHYRRILESLAVPYKVDKKLHPTRTELVPEGINAATGLVSTVRDLAQFDFALDDGTLLRDTTLATAWSAASGPEPTTTRSMSGSRGTAMKLLATTWTLSPWRSATR